MREPDSSSFETLAALADTTDPTQLFPKLRRVEGSPLPERLSLVGAAHLSTGLWFGVFGDATGHLVAAPFRRAGAALARAVPGDGAAAAVAQLTDRRHGAR